MQEEFKHKGITEKIIGCAMRVHGFLGPGFRELVYEKSLIIELRMAGLKCETQIYRDIYFRDTLVGKRRLDLLVEDKVLIELKAVSEIDNVIYNQALNYLKVFGFEVGLVLNFGTPSLQIKRLAVTKNLRNPLNP